MTTVARGMKKTPVIGASQVRLWRGDWNYFSHVTLLALYLFYMTRFGTLVGTLKVLMGSFNLQDSIALGQRSPLPPTGGTRSMKSKMNKLNSSTSSNSQGADDDVLVRENAQTTTGREKRKAKKQGKVNVWTAVHEVGLRFMIQVP
jgi:hypothetical protein